MALAYQGVELSEEELADHLGTKLTGTEVWNVLLLEPQIAGCRVRVDGASFAELEESLAADVPPIAFISTRHLRSWTRETIHAVVVCEVAGEEVHVNDPAFPDAPLVLPRREFSLAWSDLDFLTAFVVVTPRSD